MPSLAAAAPLQEFTQVDGNGVDLVSGQFFFSLVEGSIGDDESGVSLVRSWSGINGWQDNWSGVAYQTTENGQTVYYVEFGPISDSFTFSGGNFISRKGDGAILTVGGTSLAYTASDGTGYNYNGAFDDGRPFAGPRCPSGGCYIPISITKPNGRTFTLNWDFDAYFQNPLVYYRLAGVDSSANYNFSITYLTANPGQGSAPVPNWLKRTKVEFTNTLSPPSPLPTVTYAYPSSAIIDITVPGARTWRLTAAAGGNLNGIRRPGSAVDNVTIGYSVGAPTVSSVIKDGVTTSYSRVVNGTTITETRTDALSNQVVVTADTAVNRPSSVKDPLNRTTSYQYDSNKRLTRLSQPEGNYVQATYDGRGNVTQLRQVAKAGSGLADIVESAGYDATCSNQLTCNQPSNTTDAKGNVTDYTYDSTHGGVLTVTDPAPTTGAIRPQTRGSYTLTAGAYLLTGISECQTLSSCTNAVDEAKTALGYNSNALPTTVTRSNGAGTLAATSTMTYDSIGNLLTVDGPLTGGRGCHALPLRRCA
ncbi:MAG TPA: hypothetical protein VKC17_00430 [Sphingomicrobium sp.]|nr:hypothetical protein [Sphingomicrobium sp.]